jgi:DNA polymerase III delta subunit
MVTIFFGDNYVASRDKFITETQKHIGEKKHFECGEDQFSHFRTSSLSSSIFGDNLCVSVCFQKSPNADVDFSFLESVPRSNNILIWCSGKISQKSHLWKVAKESGAKMLEFSQRSSNDVFKVCDVLLSRELVPSLISLKKFTEDGGKLFDLVAPLTYSVRNILGIKLNANFTRDLAPFVAKKSADLSKKYSEEELISVFNKLFLKDVAVKSGEDGGEEDTRVFLLELFARLK